MLDLADIVYSLEIAVFSRVLITLIEPGMIFGFWGTFLAKKQWSWPAWVRYPLGACGTCLVGQIGIWSGLILEVHRHQTHIVIFSESNSLITSIVRVILHTAFVIYLAGLLNYDRRN